MGGKEEGEKIANIQYLFPRGLIVFLIGVSQKARAFVVQKLLNLLKKSLQTMN